MKVWRWLLPGILLGLCVSLWFVQRKAYPSTTNNSSTVNLADLDGDGDIDALYLISTAANTLWINQGKLQGAAQGKFVSSNQTLGERESQSASFGDLDRDGDLDLVVNFSEGFEVYLNSGGPQGGWKGNFELKGQVKAAQIRGSALGDLDNDGDLDAIFWSCCTGSTGLSVWVNDGAGNLTQVGQLLESAPILQAALGDIDGDQDLDIWIVSEDNNPGKKANSASRDTAQIWFNDSHAQFTESGQSLETSQAVALDDLDGDGDLDAVSASESGLISWINNGSGYFQPIIQRAGIRSFQSILLKDLDQDNHPDILLSSGDRAEVWLNAGQGIFERSDQRIDLPGSSAVALGDLDGDGDLDLFCGYPGDRYRIWWNDGYGRFGLSWR